MFAGLLYCADCGHCLTYSQKQRKDGTYHGAYSCWMYKTHGKEYRASHYITFDTIYEIVLADIRKNLFWYRRDCARFKEFLGGKYKSMTDKAAKQFQAEYEQKQRRAAELNRILCKLYEDNALGKIPDDRYELMAGKYETEQAEIRKSLPELAARLDELKSNSDSADKFINVIRKYTTVEKLDAAILNELIDKIIVHHKEKSDDGRTYQQIEIFYRFVGKLGSADKEAA